MNPGLVDALVVCLGFVTAAAWFTYGFYKLADDRPRAQFIGWIALSTGLLISVSVLEWRLFDAPLREALLLGLAMSPLAAIELLRRWLLLRVISNAGREEERLDALFRYRPKDFSDEKSSDAGDNPASRSS